MLGHMSPGFPEGLPKSYKVYMYSAVLVITNGFAKR